ncbi:MAG: GNAT family N-acetyltransferase [Rhodobacteraceae bacterium]|nr:GNAT family N-acetyltransferase [Paracoccaceae bacterium]
MIEYTVTYLEMQSRPSYPRPPQPVGAAMALLHAQKPPNWYFLSLYDAVGAEYLWTDMHDLPEAELGEFLRHPDMEMYTLIRNGWPAGFFMLDRKAPEICDIAYLGLVPQVIGLGLGKYMLHTAIHMAWDGPDTRTVSVNTCTLDHPRALQTYQKAGFEPVRQETKSREG